MQEKLDRTRLKYNKLWIALALTILMIANILIRLSPLIRIHWVNLVTSWILENTINILVIDVALYFIFFIERKAYYEDINGTSAIEMEDDKNEQ